MSEDYRSKCLFDINNDSIIKRDSVNHPDHYMKGGIETYDFLVAKLSREELKGYLKGNILKYISRESCKNGLEDIQKMLWYATKLEELEK